MSASFDYYRTFYYVAKYKNFTRAATMLLSSQPSVTRSIQNLESELGCRLFIRSRHGVTLTPEGEMLYRYVAPACERILRGEEELGLSSACTVEQSASEQPKLLSTACCWIGWRCSRRSIRMSKSASVTEPLLTCFPI